jgi:hypothetical protein
MPWSIGNSEEKTKGSRLGIKGWKSQPSTGLIKIEGHNSMQVMGVL